MDGLMWAPPLAFLGLRATAAPFRVGSMGQGWVGGAKVQPPDNLTGREPSRGVGIMCVTHIETPSCIPGPLKPGVSNQR